MARFDAREMQATIEEITALAGKSSLSAISPVRGGACPLRRGHRHQALAEHPHVCKTSSIRYQGKRLIQAGTTKVFEELAETTPSLC